MKFQVWETGDGGNILRWPFETHAQARAFVRENYPGAVLDSTTDDEECFVPPNGETYFAGTELARWVYIKEMEAVEANHPSDSCNF